MTEIPSHIVKRSRERRAEVADPIDVDGRPNLVLYASEMGELALTLLERARQEKAQVLIFDENNQPIAQVTPVQPISEEHWQQAEIRDRS